MFKINNLLKIFFFFSMFNIQPAAREDTGFHFLLTGIRENDLHLVKTALQYGVNPDLIDSNVISIVIKEFNKSLDKTSFLQRFNGDTKKITDLIEIINLLKKHQTDAKIWIDGGIRVYQVTLDVFNTIMEEFKKLRALENHDLGKLCCEQIDRVIGLYQKIVTIRNNEETIDEQTKRNFVSAFNEAEKTLEKLPSFSAGKEAITIAKTNLQWLTKCFGCDNWLTKYMCCNKCKISLYCSKECQVKHWPKHKKICKDISHFKINDELNQKIETLEIKFLKFIGIGTFAKDEKAAARKEAENALIAVMELLGKIDKKLIDKKELSHILYMKKGLQKACNNCNAHDSKDKNFPCGSCKKIYYCSKECQFAQSTEHKEVCSGEKEQKEVGSDSDTEILDENDYDYDDFVTEQESNIGTLEKEIKELFSETMDLPFEFKAIKDLDDKEKANILTWIYYKIREFDTLRIINQILASQEERNTEFFDSIKRSNERDAKAAQKIYDKSTHKALIERLICTSETAKAFYLKLYEYIYALITDTNLKVYLEEPSNVSTVISQHISYLHSASLRSTPSTTIEEKKEKKSEIKYCAYCKKTKKETKLKKCTNCHAVRYCSEECQKNDGLNHQICWDLYRRLKNNILLLEYKPDISHAKTTSFTKERSLTLDRSQSKPKNEFAMCESGYRLRK